MTQERIEEIKKWYANESCINTITTQDVQFLLQELERVQGLRISLEERQKDEEIKMRDMALSLAVNYLCWLKTKGALDVTELAGGFDRQYWLNEAKEKIEEEK